MAHDAIKTRGVGKEFTIGATRHNTLRDTLAAATRRLLHPAEWKGEGQRRLWALRDIDFDLAEGEVLGIIGRNGAGKSTLLKLLSRITEPTTGEISLRGRVGSLLEVGTGFHSELTGRENIFLNGAILGMKRSEILRKFDEIVDFAEVETFLDTPVKHYSSGMYLRLGFAVAAHLEPEILIVDEVLAVGDAEFQQKCLGKMGQVATEGRTIIFVSHNLDAVQRLCSRCLLLDHGTIAADGPTREVTAAYLSSDQSVVPGAVVDLRGAVRTGTGGVRFSAASYSGDLARDGVPVHAGGPLRLRVELDAASPHPVGSFAFSILSPAGQLLVNADTITLGEVVRVPAGRSTFEFEMKSLALVPGQYPVSLWAGESTGNGEDYIERAFNLEVGPAIPAPIGPLPSNRGIVFSDFSVARRHRPDGGDDPHG